MERIQSLINRLQEQLNQQANAAQMLATIQLLQSALTQSASGANKTLGTSKVSVLMPASLHFTKQEQEIESPASAYAKPKPKTQNQLDLHFDPMNEIPTLSQQQFTREVNESVTKELSLNDKLKEEKREVMQVLKDSPIKDLRKAIGINDQFVFINELFRGDEAMYERCIKTINSFNIFPEAEYWMNRELMVKLGWDENSESVTHFYSLVRRRFS
ncbi:MAG TPA: hypothetical protein VI548_06755 [Chitinophagaceae bacterium]|nr:hypothetical protein [Chitinophagaceae bacterium]